MAYRKEIESFCRANQDHPQLGEYVSALSEAFEKLTAIAEQMRDQMKTDPLQWASNTYPALIAFGEITMTWRLLDMAVIASRTNEKGKKNNLYTGKILQATYFEDVTLQHTLATMENALRAGREVIDMPDGAF